MLAPLPRRGLNVGAWLSIRQDPFLLARAALGWCVPRGVVVVDVEG